jgi:hypothetical protein
MLFMVPDDWARLRGCMRHRNLLANSLHWPLGDYGTSASTRRIARI